MTPAPSPEVTELQRVQALHRLELLDTLPEAVFDAITAAAVELTGVPIALLSLIDTDRQWFKSNVGLPGVAETPRSMAFCDHAIRDTGVMEVQDATADPRFAANPLVLGDPHIRFYAGAPIVVPSGERIGTVCVIDRQPRQLTDTQRSALQGFARIASACLDERSKRLAVTDALAVSESRYRAIVEDQSELIALSSSDGVLSFVNTAYARFFGEAPADLLGRNLLEYVDSADKPAVAEHLQAVCNGHKAVASVNRMRLRHGATRWIQWTNRPVSNEDGAVVAVQSVGRDITQQKLAEIALAHSEERYRSLYQATPAILQSIDSEGRLLSVSDRWLSRFGFARDEVIGRASHEFLTQASARQARETVLPAFLATGRSDRVEYQFVCKDGSIVDVLLSAILERNADGSSLRSMAVLEDVSATKRLQEELGRTHARLDGIVDNVPVLLGHWDEQAITRFVNREFQSAIGLPVERILGRPLREIFDAIDPSASAELVPRVADVKRGQRIEFEMAMLTTSGLRQLRVALVPDQPEPGRVTGFFGMAHDITGQKALELRLTDSELRYRSLFENLDSGFALHEVIVDAAGHPVDYRFLALNAAFSNMTGIDATAAIGRRATEVVPGIATDPADWIGLYGKVALGGIATSFEQFAAPLARWFKVVAYRPAPSQFAVIVLDITQQREAEARVQQTLKERETLLKEVYHRVKNNLQVVQSLLALQRRSLTDVSARAALEDSVQRIRAMALVHEKLYQSGNLSAVSLPAYIDDLLEQIGDAAGAARAGIKLTARVAEMRTGLDSAIPFALLVAELIGNALKHGFHGRTGGEVTVSLTQEPAGALLSIRDDGVGLASGFDLAGTSSMGLQLACTLARQLGGELSASSDHGAEFKALLSELVPA